MNEVTIRPMHDVDWPAVSEIVAEVAEAGETYAMDVPADEAAVRAFWHDTHTVVAEVDGVVVGAAKMGPNRPAQGAHVGTASFLVSAAARGQGIGRALGEYTVWWLRNEGYRSIQFNAVVDSNRAAVRLWQSLGFRIIGTVPEAFRRPTGEYTGLHVMWLDLQSNTP